MNILLNIASTNKCASLLQHPKNPPTPFMRNIYWLNLVTPAHLHELVDTHHCDPLCTEVQ